MIDNNVNNGLDQNTGMNPNLEPNPVEVPIVNNQPVIEPISSIEQPAVEMPQVAPIQAVPEEVPQPVAEMPQQAVLPNENLEQPVVEVPVQDVPVVNEEVVAPQVDTMNVIDTPVVPVNNLEQPAVEVPVQDVPSVDDTVVIQMNTMNPVDSSSVPVNNLEQPQGMMNSTDMNQPMMSTIEPVNTVQNTMEQPQGMMNSTDMNQPNMEVQPMPSVEPVQMTDPNVVNIDPMNAAPAGATMNNEVNVNQIQGKPKNSNVKSILIIILILAIVGVAGFFAYKFFGGVSSPKVKFMSSINQTLLNNNGTLVNDVFTFMSKGYNANIDGALSLDVDGEKKFEGNFVINAIDRPIDKKQYLKMSLTPKEGNGISLEGLLTEDKFYANIKDVFDKFYFMEDYQYINQFGENTLAIKDNLLRTFNAYFTEEKFVESEATYNGSNAEKITISMSEKDFCDLMIKVFENILADEKSLNALVSADMTVEEAKSTLQDAVTSLKESIAEADTKPAFIYDMYFDGKNLLAQEIKFEDSAVITLTGNESGTISVKVEGDEFVTGTYSKDTITLKVVDDETKADIVINFSENITQDKIDGTYSLTFSMDDSINKINFSLTFKYTIDNNNNIPNIDLSTAKSIEEMTVEESTAISNNLMEKTLIGDIMKDYSNMVSSAVSQNNMSGFDTDFDMDTEFDMDTNFDVDTDFDINDGFSTGVTPNTSYSNTDSLYGF